MKPGVDTTFLVQVSVREHPGHAAARQEMDRRLAAGDTFVLAPQVLCEMVHIVTDPRRFEHPLETEVALSMAQAWWDARETQQAAPTPASMAHFWRWMKEHRLGSKRLLDTMLAATYHSHGVEAILSSDARDYTPFGCFEVIAPA
jgi:predicted nucleic acid-binding protein